MARIDRRVFLQSLSALAPAAAACTSRAAAPGATTVDPSLLRALATVVLPTELNTTGVDQVTAAFLTWLEGYRPAAELNHDYGSGEIRYAGGHPAPGWNAQLQALNLEAQARHLSSFTELSNEQRLELVAAALRGERVTEFPQPQYAYHVAVGLLAFYYATPEATDRAYRAEIGTNRCRPLGDAPNQPRPIPRV